MIRACYVLRSPGASGSRNTRKEGEITMVSLEQMDKFALETMRYDTKEWSCWAYTRANSRRDAADRFAGEIRNLKKSGTQFRIVKVKE